MSVTLLLPAARGLAGEVCATEGAPFPGMEVSAGVAFPLLTMPFAERDGKAGTAFPAPTGTCLGVGMLAAVLLGCLSGTSAPACTDRQAWLPVSPCRKAGLNRATDSHSNSATQLKAMQTQPKCDNNARLVTDKHRHFKHWRAKRKCCDTSCMCDTFRNMFASPAGFNLMLLTLRRMYLDG